jgi:hypothetical protein
MGYKRKVLHLTFEDKPGLEIYVRSVNVRRALNLMRLADKLTGGQVTDLAEAEKVTGELFGAFADRVVSWTLMEDDEDETPVPVSLDSLLDWDFDDAINWVLTWVQQATSVTVPTAAPANGTGTGLEASIPMASTSGM